MKKFVTCSYGIGCGCVIVVTVLTGVIYTTIGGIVICCLFLLLLLFLGVAAYYYFKAVPNLDHTWEKKIGYRVQVRDLACAIVWRVGRALLVTTSQVTVGPIKLKSCHRGPP